MYLEAKIWKRELVKVGASLTSMGENNPLPSLVTMFAKRIKSDC